MLRRSLAIWNQYRSALKQNEGIYWTAESNPLSRWHQHAAFVARSVNYYLKLRLQNHSKRPGIAGIVVGRNDDYIADFERLLTATIDWNTRLLLDEVVFVEWNPAPDRELLSLKLAARFPCLKAYIVPASVHEKLSKTASYQLLEYHAKNVGIRRAKSQWIIATNGDTLFAPDTIYRLLNSTLPPEVAWRTRRADINWRTPRSLRPGLLRCLRLRRMLSDIQLGTGEFLLASREVWQKIRGYDESLVEYRLNCDARGAAQMLALGARLRNAGLVFHVAHASSNSESVQPHHGERYPPLEGLPYENSENWGLGNYREVQLAERVWRLEE